MEDPVTCLGLLEKKLIFCIMFNFFKLKEVQFFSSVVLLFNDVIVSQNGRVNSGNLGFGW